MALTMHILWLSILLVSASASGQDLPPPAPIAESPPLPDLSADWKWISVPGTRCADGSETGFALNLASQSNNKLVINFGGGGACYGYWSCHVESAARNMNKPYTEKTFMKQKRPERLAKYFILDRSTKDNPFYQSNYAYLPYCTGDLHAGDAEPIYRYSRKKPTYHHGYKNGKLILQAIKSAMNGTKIDQVWMTGSSAGGFGAIYHYFNALDTFGHDQAISLIADSSESKGSAYIYSGWNTQLPSKDICKECDYSHFDSFVPAYAKLRPNDRFAVLSYKVDPILPLYMNFTFVQLSREIQSYFKDLGTTSNARGFMLPGINHIVMNKASPKAVNGLSLTNFLQQMVSGKEWKAGII